MRVEDGLKLEGRLVEIPDCGRKDLAVFFSETGRKVGVEVGVYHGEYTKILCEAGLKVYGVDHWHDYNGYTRPKHKLPSREQTATNLKGYDCTLIDKFSAEALLDFEDESLDFVYIDANHTLPYVVADIFGWERKVKKGGIIAGHDYAMIQGADKIRNHDGCHVKIAVDVCANVMKIPKYYILGLRFPPEGGWRDKIRSWFWIKE